MSALALDLADRGWASWNIEYRRVGTGGGPSEMLDDVRAALHALPQLEAPLDLGRVLVIGHSAGGQLGLCVAAEPPIAGVISLAGVCDLVAAARERIGDSAALELIGADAGGATGGLRDRRPAAASAGRRAGCCSSTGTRTTACRCEQSRTYASAAIGGG